MKRSLAVMLTLLLASSTVVLAQTPTQTPAVPPPQQPPPPPEEQPVYEEQVVVTASKVGGHAFVGPVPGQFTMRLARRLDEVLEGKDPELSPRWLQPLG